MIMKKIGTWLMILASLCLIGCSIQKDEIEDLTDTVNKYDVESIKISDVKYQAESPKEAIYDFAFHVMLASDMEKNQMISPLSIVSALGMTANGANGNTLKQMFSENAEDQAIIQTDLDTLNSYLESYMKYYLPSKDDYKVSVANSIWIRDDEHLHVNEEFLKTNKTYYEAEVFLTAFDERTAENINAWVADKTENMIDKIVNEGVGETAVMFLVNAVYFEAEWKKIYEEYQVEKEGFTTETGELQVVDMMRSTEEWYLESECAIGVLKPYKDNKYAFVGLLPNEGMGLEEFLETLTGEEIVSMLDHKKSKTVLTKIPKFSLEYEIPLNDVLQELGMMDAFDELHADFSGLATSDVGNLYISRVLHKTKIEVDEKGTKAAAATVVEIEETTEVETEEPKVVYLDRPFVYMIIDMQQNLPIFIGCMTNVTE